MTTREKNVLKFLELVEDTNHAKDAHDSQNVYVYPRVVGINHVSDVYQLKDRKSDDKLDLRYVKIQRPGKFTSRIISENITIDSRRHHRHLEIFEEEIKMYQIK